MIPNIPYIFLSFRFNTLIAITSYSYSVADLVSQTVSEIGGKGGFGMESFFLSNLSIIAVFGCCPSVANRGWSSVEGGPGYAGIPLFCLHFRFIVVFYCCRILKCSLYFNRARRGIIFIQYTIVLPYRTPRCIRHACTHTWKVKTKFGSNVDCKV